MKKSVLFLSLSLVALTSCFGDYNNSYVIYFGNQYISVDSFDYSSIDMKETQNNYDESVESELYANIYLLYEDSEVEELKSEAGYIDNGEEISIPDEKFLIYFFVQIPASYSVVRRENIQYVDTTDTEVLVTDNFYQLASRRDLFYCFVDLEEAEEADESVFSFYYYVSDIYENTMIEANIRVILSL